MPIVDNVLLGPGNLDEFEYPTQATGDYLDHLLQKNLEERGDGPWMVSILDPVISIKWSRDIRYIQWSLSLYIFPKNYC